MYYVICVPMNIIYMYIAVNVLWAIIKLVSLLKCIHLKAYIVIE